MTLTPLSLLESGRKKFLMNSTYIMSRKWESNVFGNQTFLGSGGRNDSNTAQFVRIGKKKILIDSTFIMSRRCESNVFGLRRPK